MKQERVANIVETTKDNVRKGKVKFVKGLQDSLVFVKEHQRDIITGAITVFFVGGAVYYAYKGKMVFAIGSTCCAILTKPIVANAYIICNKAIEVSKSIKAKCETVEACNAETC